MKIHDATETAYRNGYEQGKKDAIKHGKWVVKHWRAWCSECNGYTPGYTPRKTDYCPHCGAKMDEKEMT